MFPTRMMVCVESPAAFQSYKLELGWVARHLGAGLVLFHAEPMQWTELGPLPSRMDVARRHLDSLVDDPALVGIEVKTLVAESPAPLADMIFRAASDNGVDLIVVPTHGRSGIDRLLFGSVAEHVVRACRFPVMTFDLERVPSRRDEAPFDRLIVPLDLSVRAEHIFDVVAHFSLKSKCGITLTHVIEDGGVAAYVDLDSAALRQRRETVTTRVKAYLDERALVLRSRVEQPVDVRISSGHLLPEVRALAAEFRNPLICLTTQGRDSVGDHVLGSRAERIIRGAHASVVSLPMSWWS